jgi:hypothetical protein
MTLVRTLLLIAALSLPLLFTQGMNVAAQDSTPPASGLLEYEVLLVEGTCPAPALSDATSLGVARPPDDAEILDDEADQGLEEVIIDDLPRSTLAVTLDRQFDAFLDGDLAIVARNQSGAGGSLVVCGEVARQGDGDRVTIELAPTEGSAVTGSAVLRAVDEGTRISVSLHRSALYVTAVPVDLEPGRIVLFMTPAPGAVEFVIFNQLLDEQATFAISGPGIDGTREVALDPGHEAFLTVVLEEGVYRISCAECGERADEVVEVIVIEEAASTPTP